jgi:hypothetical protein
VIRTLGTEAGAAAVFSAALTESGAIRPKKPDKKRARNNDRTSGGFIGMLTKFKLGQGE